MTRDDGQGGFRDVRAALQGRVDGLVAHLLPGKWKRGNYWVPPNPSRDDRNPGSFYIWLRGASAGGFRDEATGQTGDVIDLIALVKRCDRLEALRWGRDWLGWTGQSPAQIKAEAKKATDEAKARDEAEAAEMARKRVWAKARWLQALPREDGDPVDLYLRGRGIALEGSGVAAHAVRHAPEVLHRETGAYFHCAVSAMSDRHGQIVAIHRVFIDQTHGAWVKADVDPVRKIFPGGWRGSVIRLNKGATGLSPEQAGKRKVREPVALTEGIEDGLAVAVSRPELRVWAVGSLGNLAHAPRLPCVSEFIVCADNDWGKPHAQAQLDAALAALAATGAAVSVVRSPVGKDMNDLLRGQQEKPAKEREND